jgi:hypothetical protein
VTNSFTLVPGICTNIDAGLILGSAGYIGDRVWYDANGDGIQDLGEMGAADVPMALLDSVGNVLANTTTTSAGWYQFLSVQPGDYRVQITPPSGFNISPKDQTDDDWDSDGDVNGLSHLISVAAGQEIASVDFGLTSGSYNMTTIGNYVWFDGNGNGLQDGPEAGASGVIVTLFNSFEMPVDATTTDEFGAYSFTGLTPDNYSVGFYLPQGYGFTAKDAGGDTIDSDADVVTGRTAFVSVIAGQVTLDLDAGLVTVSGGTVSDRVWFDENANGIQDGGEPGIPGITVQLLDSTGAVIDETITNGAGIYTFNAVAAGSYKVRVVVESTTYFSAKDQGSDDTLDSDANGDGTTDLFALGEGQQLLSIDFGITEDDDINGLGGLLLLLREAIIMPPP